MKNVTFKDELDYKIIPMVSRMIDKECDHLIWLKKKRQTGSPAMIDIMIGRSLSIMSHLQQRLVEYQQYSKKLTYVLNHEVSDTTGDTQSTGDDNQKNIIKFEQVPITEVK